MRNTFGRFVDFQDLDMSTSRERIDNQFNPPMSLPGRAEGSGSLDQFLSAVEKKEIINALKKAGGRRTLAARILGISRSRLYRRMEALGIAYQDPPHGHA